MNEDKIRAYKIVIHEEDLSVTDLPSENFSEYCKSQLKINSKNNYLQEKFKYFLYSLCYDSSISYTDSRTTEEKILKQLSERRKQREFERQNHLHISNHGNDHPSLIFFFIRDKDLKKLVPDYEFIACKKYFSALISSNNSCHEAYFGLGRLYGYEGRYYEGLKYMNIAISIYPDIYYIQ